jgi:hypothetical protein
VRQEPVRDEKPDKADDDGQHKQKHGGNDDGGGKGHHLAQRIIDYAMQFRGTPYVWGGSSPEGFDCSGLIQYVYNHFGMKMPRVADAQARVGKRISAEEARPGDLVYFENDASRPGFDHIGIYLGHGMMLVAPRTGSTVQIQPVGTAAGFDRVLPHESFASMKHDNGNFVYRLPSGEGVGKAAMQQAPEIKAPHIDVGHADLSKAEIRAGLDSMGFASELIHSNKSLQRAFNEIISKGIDISTSAGRARAVAIFKNTDWFRNHTASQRKFANLKHSDPATFEQTIKQTRQSLKAEAQGLGIDLSGDQLDRIAKMVVRNGLTTDETNQILARHFHYRPHRETYAGVAGASIDAIQQEASAYYVPISRKQMQHYTRQVIAGNLDPNSLRETFKQQALSMFPYLKDQLNEGRTVADIVDPYKQLMANTLEISPDDIDHKDRTILRALQSKGHDGTVGLMPLWQFQQELYDDPRWMHTMNAKQSVLSATGKLLQKWGLIS